jgi:glycosyltransferase involved in cell wall biosynthesis
MVGARISIITIVRNAPNALARTLKSLSEQRSLPFEHLIVDGASTDIATIEIANEYCQAHAWARLVSERDKGISDALNKGVRLALGEFIICMNAGDCFYSPDSLTQILERMSALTSPFVLYGQTELRYPDFASKNADADHRDLNSICSFWNPICHQATVVPRETLLRNPFKYDLKFSMDLDLWLTLLDQGLPFYRSNDIYCKYEIGGVSSRPENIPKIIQEHMMVYRRANRAYKAIPAGFVRARHFLEQICGRPLQILIQFRRKRRRL